MGDPLILSQFSATSRAGRGILIALAHTSWRRRSVSALPWVYSWSPLTLACVVGRRSE